MIDGTDIFILGERAQIDARISKIERFEYFGDWKHFKDNLSELRWKNGRRIHFVKVDQKTILLLCGGLKNAQKKDIKRARLILQRYTSG